MNTILDKIQSLKNLPLNNKKTLALLAVGCLVVVYVDYASLMKAQLRGISATNKKIVKIQKDISGLHKEFATMEEAKRKLAEQKEIPKSKSKIIITEEQMPALLEAISGMANKRNIQIGQIRPIRETKKEVKGKKDKVVETKKFSILYIALDLSCEYHNLGLFISDLENTPEFIWVQDIKLNSDNDNYFKQRATVLLKTYVKK